MSTPEVGGVTVAAMNRRYSQASAAAASWMLQPLRRAGLGCRRLRRVRTRLQALREQTGAFQVGLRRV
jgi:hypothetical protein